MLLLSEKAKVLNLKRKEKKIPYTQVAMNFNNQSMT